MDRLNAYMVCTRCCDVLEAIFFAPAGARPVYDRRAVGDHARTHPACVGSQARIMTQPIEPQQYALVSGRY